MPTSQPRDRTADVQRLLQQLEKHPVSGPQRRKAALILKKLGAPLEALAFLERTATLEPEDWVLRYELNHAVHRQPEAALCMDRAISAFPADTGLALRGVQFRRAAKDLKTALSLCERALTDAPENPDLLRHRADLSSRLRPNDADADIEAAWLSPPTEWWLILDCWARIGRFERIDDALRERLQTHPQDATTCSYIGRMALWRGDTQGARKWAEAAQALAPEHPEAVFLLGASDVLDGQHKQAEPLLRSALKDSKSAAWLQSNATWTFLAVCLREQGQYVDGRAAGHQAMTASREYNVAAQVAFLTNAMELSTKSSRVDPAHLKVASRVYTLVDEPAVSWDGSSRHFRAGMQQVQARLSGNRTSLSSWVDAHGVLHQHKVPPYPRHLGRMLQMQIRCRPKEDVLQDFKKLQAAHPDDPTVRTYRGELLVWLGEYEAAAKDFKAAIALDPRTTWAWIGLGATHLYSGEYAVALSTLAQGIIEVQYEGPTIYVYRGEANRLIGNLDEAARDLTQASIKKPRRLSAWLNWALLASQQGSHAPAAILGNALARTNPSLWQDAGPSSDPAERLRNCLSLMRGNRSSGILTYMTPGGIIRLCRWSASDVPEQLRAALEG